MWNVLENSWLLLTIAGVAFVVASVVRQEKSEWGYKPLLIPLLLALLAFGLDYFFTTDYEDVSAIVPACKRAAVNNDPAAISKFISPNYRDRHHLDKAAMDRAVESRLQRASIKKIRTQAHVVTIDGDQAQSRLNVGVHLNRDSKYSAAGTFVLVEMEFEYEKIGDQWLIQRMDVSSVNQQSMDWGDIPM